MFAELRAELERARDLIAERLAALDDAEAALARLRDVFGIGDETASRSGAEGAPSADAASRGGEVPAEASGRPGAATGQQSASTRSCRVCGGALPPRARAVCSRDCRRADDRAQKRAQRAHRKAEAAAPAPEAESGGSPSLSSRYSDDQRGAIEQALAEGRVTRVENGSWPDTHRPELYGRGWIASQRRGGQRAHRNG